MKMYYEQARKFAYGIAKHFGIASERMVGGTIKEAKYVKWTLVIPKYIREVDREHDDDRWYIYENVGGTQIFPFNKNFLKQVEISFGWDSLYRDYIRQRVEGRK